MSYYPNRPISRPIAKRRTGSPELMYLLVVLVAGFATAWWVSHQIGMDLSGITSLVSILGITENGRLTHGVVGYSANAPAAEAQAAPYCSPGQTPAFGQALSSLKQRLGDTMGVPLECEHAAVNGGDTIAQTTTGLAVFTNATNTASFTDGWRHWAITPSGFTQWEGTESRPPSTG